MTTRTEETDLVWSRDKPSITSLSTANTADLIKSVESIKTEEIEKNLQNLELSAIEPAAGSPNSTLKAEEIIPQEKGFHFISSFGPNFSETKFLYFFKLS